MLCLMMYVLPVFLVAICGHVTSSSELKVVDLTHTHGPSVIYWPGNPEYNFTILARGMSSNGYWYESNSFQTAEHTGTHVDAPAHFANEKQREHQIPMQNLTGPGVIVDVKTKVANNPDYRVNMADLMAWESKYKKIPTGAVVMMNSGWDTKYPNKTLAFGSETPNDPGTFHFPGWHEDAVDWLIKNRNIHVIGVDTPSTDYGKSATFPVHIVLGTANIPGVENVANLDSMPYSGAMVYVAAIKLYDGSGGPARVFATYGEGSITDAATSDLPSIVLLTVMSAVLLSYSL